MLIGLQAGHQNIQLNVDPVLQTETGAPGEEQLNVAVRDRLGQILIAHGFQVQLDDANANSNPNTTNTDFSFYLALHAEGEPQGGAISAPDPSYDDVNEESKRICSDIESVYFTETGITDNPKIITVNMTEYYMWDCLTGPTPCGIIEMGALADAHDSVLLANTELIAGGIAKGICKAFNVPFDPVASPTPESSTNAPEVVQTEKSPSPSATTPQPQETAPISNSEKPETPVFTPPSTQVSPLAHLRAIIKWLYDLLIGF